MGKIFIVSAPLDPSPVTPCFRRNAATWNKRGLASAAERFDYDYPERELAVFIPRLHELASSAAAVHVIFNVNKEDQGVRGARMMLRLVGESKVREKRQATPKTSSAA